MDDSIECFIIWSIFLAKSVFSYIDKRLFRFLFKSIDIGPGANKQKAFQISRPRFWKLKIHFFWGEKKLEKQFKDLEF